MYKNEFFILSQYVMQPVSFTSLIDAGTWDLVYGTWYHWLGEKISETLWNNAGGRYVISSNDYISALMVNKW